MILEVIKVHKANQVEFILNYNYMAVHTKCVTLTNSHMISDVGRWSERI